VYRYRKQGLWVLLLAGLVLSGCGGAVPGDDARVDELILVTTTSTYDSGLLDVLIPLFEQQSGYQVKPIPVGTGAALAMAAQGEADVVLVHAPAAERELVEQGVLVARRLVMYNDFVVVGPPDDPAGVQGAGSAAEALARIRAAGALFLSRGDDSGTHKKERALWNHLGVEPAGRWYQETGEGMGQTLRMAAEKQGYTLTDRGTFLALKDTLDLKILFAGDPQLLNLYHVAQVNPERFPQVNASGAQAFVEFMVSQTAQEVISQFGRDRYGEPLFVPAADKTEAELLGGRIP